MAGTKKSLGQAIDAIADALNGLEKSTQMIAINSVCAQLNIAAGTKLDTVTQSDVSTVSTKALDNPEDKKIIDIRSLKEEKKPNSATEMACVVAYYLENYAPETRTTITSKDIEKYYKQANFPLPKALNQVLIDAKAAGYFDSPKRSAYKLNPVGHNLVVHTLPRGKKKA